MSTRPKLYFQEGKDEECSRIRIIYPDGSCEWIISGSGNLSFSPCWATGKLFSSMVDFRPWNLFALGICKSQREAIRLMHAYDRRQGFPRALYLGEL